MIQAGNLNIVQIGGGRVKGKVIRGRSQSTSAVPQKELIDMQSSGGSNPPDDSYDLPEPEPDYQDDDVIDAPTEKENTMDMLSHTLNEQVILRERKSSNSDLDKRLSDPGNDELLIKPKKLANPCIASPTRMALHKELLHNYKMGKNILEKSELNKVFDKVKEKQRTQEWESQKKPNKRTSLELKLEQQATRLKEQEDSMKPIKEKVESESELSRMQSKILSRSMNGSTVK